MALEIKELLPFVSGDGEEWVLAEFRDALIEGGFHQSVIYNVRIAVPHSTPLSEVVARLEAKARETGRALASVK